MSKDQTQIIDEEEEEEEEEEKKGGGGGERRKDREIEIEECNDLQMDSIIESFGATRALDEYLNNDILDMSKFNIDDEQTWLMPGCSSCDLGYDLNIWLHTGMCKKGDQSIDHDNSGYAGSSINTKTFTRPKKKLGKLHFDEANNANDLKNKIEINWREEAIRSKDCIPAMFKQSLPGVVKCGEESLEAFLNMSHSKGIDSFINMDEPDLTDDSINVSRSTQFHVNTTNTILGNAYLGCMADSQILTESMMQTSIFNDIDDTIKQDFDKTLHGEAEGSIKMSSASTKVQENAPLPFLQCDDDDELDKTFDKPLSIDQHLSYTITVEESGLRKKLMRRELKHLDTTFDTDPSFTKISLNSTFKAPCNIDTYGEREPIIKDDCLASNFTYIADDQIDESSLHPEVEKRLLNPDEQELLDMTYSKVENSESLFKNNVDSNNDNLQVKSGIDESKKNILSINRFQTFRKFVKNNKINGTNEVIRNKIPLDRNKDNQVKSMENLHKVNPLKDYQEIYPKLNGAQSLSRLPPPLRQKSNPNLASHLPTVVMKNRSMLKKNEAFEGKLRKKSMISSVTNKCNLNKNKKSNMINVTSSSDSIDDIQSSTVDYDSKFNKARYERGEELNLQSTPNCGRKILENTWITNENDLPSPILKNDNINGKQTNSAGCSDSGVQTSSPLISPAESLQSLAVNSRECNLEGVTEISGAISSTSVAGHKEKSTNKTETVRLPMARSANATSGIPRPMSRIPAPKFSRTNPQMKNNNNFSKKGLF